MTEVDELNDINKLLKRNMLETIKTANTGHLGACCSSSELMTALYFGKDILQINTENPDDPRRDLVLARGHLGPLRYNIFSLLGWMKPSEMAEYRKFGSRMQGHEDMNRTPGVDLTPSGSLGMLLSYSVGARHMFKQKGLENRLFCFLGDGEEQEGNVSEAARHASNLQLDGVITIIDKNGKQLSSGTGDTDSGADLSKIWQGYGWNVLEIEDGHDMSQILNAYREGIDLSKKGPVCIIANTIKGNGVPGAEKHYAGYHSYHGIHPNNIPEGDVTKTRAPALEEVIDSIEVPSRLAISQKIIQGRALPKNNDHISPLIVNPDRSEGGHNASEYLQEFLGKLSDLTGEENLHILTPDYPQRSFIETPNKFFIPGADYINVGIREQHTFAMAHGMRTINQDDPIILLGGDPFFYRSADQLNVLAQAKDKVILYSAQAGLSCGRNGATHQSSGQPGMALMMPGLAFFEPSSKKDWFYAMNHALNRNGPTYVRADVLPAPFEYTETDPSDAYEINPTRDAEATVFASGMTVYPAVKAVEKMRAEGRNIRLVNIVNVKDPVGVETLIEPDRPALFFYNGNPNTLSYPVLDRVATYGEGRPSEVVKRGFEIGETGSIKELMNHFELDDSGIYKNVKEHV